MGNWRNRPTFIEKIKPDKYDYVLFIDENGCPSMKNIINNPSYYVGQSDIFTITGVAIKVSDLNNVRLKIRDIKFKHWKNGIFKYKNKYKRVHFHSREIRKKLGPFNPKIINIEDFLNDLNNFMDWVPMTIFSSSIDKVKHYNEYCYPEHPYNLCLNFILERFTRFFLLPNQTAIIVIERRGTDQDKFTLSHLKYFIDNGSYYITTNESKKIKGVYFNGKWSEERKEQETHYGLEIADLTTYPIYKFIQHGNKDPAFKVIEPKLQNYPEYRGCGIKLFP